MQKEGKYDEDGRAFRKETGGRGEQEFPLFPPNKAFPYFDTRIDIDSNETIKKGRKTMKVNIYINKRNNVNRCKKEKKDRKKKEKNSKKNETKGKEEKREGNEKKKLRVKRGPLTFGKWCTGGAAYERRPAKEKDRHV